MSDVPSLTKAVLRERVRVRLHALAVAVRAELSAKLVTQLPTQRIWARAQTVLFFSPLAGEPDIRPLIGQALHAGKLAALPFFEPGTKGYSARFIRNPDTDMATGEFGILEPRSSCEPAPLKLLDLVLVPGVAFDAQGRRLGRGKGFYDRLLAQVRGTTCGVAFDEQIVEAVPVEPHDVRLNCILTPTRLIET